MLNLYKIVKDIFIERLVEYLKSENKELTDVCYMVSPLHQNLDSCIEFISDITKNSYCFNGYEGDNTGGYTNGRVQVLIEKPEEEKESEMMGDAYYNYYYEIKFGYDERYWGYCDCEPEHEGYNDENGCCGNGCDWTAPSFQIVRVSSVGGHKWEGQASDYWNYKEQFNANEKLRDEEYINEQKRIQKETIELNIKQLQKELLELNNT